MLVRRGFFSRGIAEADSVQYELAGFPHLTKPIFDVSGEFLAVNQIPVDARPFCRAAFRNIKRWLEGTPPPAGRYIDGALRGTTFVVTRDDDGNATGGVRAPHMPSIDAHGNVAGALPVDQSWHTHTMLPMAVAGPEGDQHPTPYHRGLR
jgi:hypothetical protein